MTARPAFDWSTLVSRPIAVLAIWGVWCVAALALLPLKGLRPAGPDDYMRLLEVRDLLAGQPWFDVTQYRIDPPHGASMHWSRLVDLPLAAVAALAGETAALTIVPLLYLLPALFALRAIMLRLGFAPLALGIGLAVMPLFPLLPDMFLPMRIDHHAPQAVLGLVAAALLLHPSRKAAAMAGIASAGWVAISIEGLPIVAAIAGIYGLLYWLDADRRLPAFLAALAVAAPTLSLATRPASAFALPYCDVLAPGHMAAFAAAAAIAFALPSFPAQNSARGRLAGLAAIPMICAPLAYVSLGQCAANPFSQLEPLLQQYWYGYITEGLPIWRQPLSVAVMLAWTLAVAAAGWWLMRSQRDFAQRRTADIYALLTALACLYSFWLMREGIVAQLLAIPFAAYLLARYLPRARALKAAGPRIAATLACLMLATPVFASAALKPLDPVFASRTMRAGIAAPIDPRPCDFGALAALDAGHVLAPLDIGPEILGKTDHTIVMASYHRNQQRMHDVIAAYIGSAEAAREIVDRNKVDYVLACAAEADLALYRTAAPDNFANALVSGNVPAWLAPVAGFSSGPLRVYRVK